MATSALEKQVSTPQKEERVLSRADALKELDHELGIRDSDDRQEARQAVVDYARRYLEETGTKPIPRSISARIKAVIAEIDRKVSEQLSDILHHPDFQALDGTWRGLDYLVKNSELETNVLEIQVLNISKDEITAQMQEYGDPATWDQSPLFDKIYTQEFGVFGGRPFGCLIGDYYWDHSTDDVDTLEGISKIAGAAYAPFISSVRPQLFGVDDWREIYKKRELAKIFSPTNKKYARWNKMRDNLDSRFIALTMPRVLAREPYGAKTRKTGDYAFQEEMTPIPLSEEEKEQGITRDTYSWFNSAYAMARNIGQAFKEYRWCVRIRGVESGGLVERLPLHVFESSDGTTDVKIPSEVLIPDRRESELSALGFIPICYIKNSPDAVFVGGQSLHRPGKYGGKKRHIAAANHELAARIPYTFAVCRVTHFLKSMVRDKVGSTLQGPALQKWLQEWIDEYVLPNPDDAGEELLAEKPLRAAKVVVEPVLENPGYYRATITLVPHYQLEGMTTEIAFDTELMQAKG